MIYLHWNYQKGILNCSIMIDKFKYECKSVGNVNSYNTNKYRI